jgi:small subunit ribosomal protein S16
MLIIRFQRVGRTNDPAFRIVVTEKQNAPKSGKALELLGSYHPKTKQTNVKKDRVLHWVSQGAQVSDTAYNHLLKQGVFQGKPRLVKVKRPKAEAVAAS